MSGTKIRQLGNIGLLNGMVCSTIAYCRVRVHEEVKEGVVEGVMEGVAPYNYLNWTIKGTNLKGNWGLGISCLAAIGKILSTGRLATLSMLQRVSKHGADFWDLRG